MNYVSLNDGYFSVTNGGIRAFGFRWINHAEPGRWLVHIVFGICWIDTAAVVDDFGDLVAV